jgi:hypothetical protein
MHKKKKLDSRKKRGTQHYKLTAKKKELSQSSQGVFCENIAHFYCR